MGGWRSERWNNGREVSGILRNDVMNIVGFARCSLVKIKRQHTTNARACAHLTNLLCIIYNFLNHLARQVL